MRQIALLVPDASYGERWQPHAAALAALLEGALPASVTFHCWRSDPAPLRDAALVLPLFAWGYQHFAGQWYALLDWLEAEGVNVHNPAALLRWNSDKAYLPELEAGGVPVVETRWSDALAEADLAAARAAFGRERLLVKPPVSGGSCGTYVLGPGEAIPADVAGRRMMVQPMLDAVHDEGEYSLFYFAGGYSHALRKVPKTGDFRVQEQFGAKEVPVEPDAEARAVAQRTLAAIPLAFGPEPPLYARIDLLRDNEGRLALIELEAIEPSLFLSCAPDGGAALAAAVGRRLA